MSSADPQHPATPMSLEDYREVLLANNAVYKWLRRGAEDRRRQGRIDDTLTAIQHAAAFAERHHCGRFADGALENIALQIGAELAAHQQRRDTTTLDARDDGTRRHVVHVATRVYVIGGHTRMLRHWIENDRKSRHSLVLVNQGAERVPEWLQTAITEANGALHVLGDDLSIPERALALRHIAQRDATYVILHNHPGDVVPVLAFALPGGPPVALLNHADHVFWLGSTVSDLVIDLRSRATPFSRSRRFAKRSAVLPIPLSATVATTEDERVASRIALGMPIGDTILLSIGRVEKYRPSGSYSFLQTAARILDAHPDAHCYVIGALKAQLAPYVGDNFHERLHLVGNVENPAPYRTAADIYIESFPFGSNTALLEAAEAALPVVPAYAPLFPLLVAANDSLDDVVGEPQSETEFRERVHALVADASERRVAGDRLRERVARHHTGAGWITHLEGLYDVLATMQHAPAPLPATHCELSDGDIGLTLNHFFSRDATLGTPRRAMMADIAFHTFDYAVGVSREMGNHATARGFAIRGVLKRPSSQKAWRLLAVATLGGTAKWVAAAIRLGRRGKPRSKEKAQ